MGYKSSTALRVKVVPQSLFRANDRELGEISNGGDQTGSEANGSQQWVSSAPFGHDSSDSSIIHWTLLGMPAHNLVHDTHSSSDFADPQELN